MSKLLKKVLSTVLAVAMVGAMSTSVFAGEQEKDYVVTYSAEEVTDIDALLNMAMSQKEETKISTFGASPYDPYDFTVKQLLETRLYENGTVEELHSATNLLVLDEVGNRLTTLEYNQKYATGGVGNVAAVFKMYYQNTPVTVIPPSAVYINVNSISTTVTANYSGYPVNFTQMYHLSTWDRPNEDEMNSQTTYSASTNTEYSLYTNSQILYFLGGTTVIYGGTTVTVGNGQSFVVRIDII